MRESPESNISSAEKRQERRWALNMGFDVVSRNQRLFSPEEQELLRSNLLTSFASAEIIELASERLNPQAIERVLTQRATPQQTGRKSVLEHARTIFHR